MIGNKKRKMFMKIILRLVLISVFVAIAALLGHVGSSMQKLGASMTRTDEKDDFECGV